jgi:hypothetical protein
LLLAGLAFLTAVGFALVAIGIRLLLPREPSA